MRAREVVRVPELEAMARAAGRAGKDYADFASSDELGDAVDKLGRDLDTRACEAAFCEGRREYREGGGWRSVWTTAPESYDGFGTETAEGPFEWEGRQLRRVLVDPDFYGWQTGRYPNDWDEDPRAVEARIRETLARENREREVAQARRAGGLSWLREVADDFLAGDDDAVDEEARSRGLGWEDVRAERTRRTEEKAAAARVAEWARCTALVPAGATLVDDGAPSRQGAHGYRIPGREARAWRSVVVQPHYSCPDDADLARVYEVRPDSRLPEEPVGSLADVAARIERGELRVAGPEDVVPPRAVVDRIGCPFDEVARVEAFGRVAWVGCQLYGQTMVLDDAGNLIRTKKLREAVERVQRERYFGGLRARSFKLFGCAHGRIRAVRFFREGVEAEARRPARVCTVCGAVLVEGEREWRDLGCLELNVGGPAAGYQEGDRADLLGAP